MLNQPMIEKLLAMRLHGMVEALKTQEQDRSGPRAEFPRTTLPAGRSAMELAREPGAGATTEERPSSEDHACVEDIDYRAARGLDKTVLRALAKDSAWVRNHENLFVIGPTGVGKSFIASALAQKACRDGYSALYTSRCCLAPRSGPGTRRRELAPLPGATGSRRCSGHR